MATSVVPLLVVISFIIADEVVADIVEVQTHSVLSPSVLLLHDGSSSRHWSGGVLRVLASGRSVPSSADPRLAASGSAWWLLSLGHVVKLDVGIEFPAPRNVDTSESKPDILE